jgi:hypothetical protein
MTMSAVTNTSELLTKCHTITFTMTSSDKLQWPPIVSISFCLLIHQLWQSDAPSIMTQITSLLHSYLWSTNTNISETEDISMSEFPGTKVEQHAKCQSTIWAPFLQWVEWIWALDPKKVNETCMQNAQRSNRDSSCCAPSCSISNELKTKAKMWVCRTPTDARKTLQLHFLQTNDSLREISIVIHSNLRRETSYPGSQKNTSATPDETSRWIW